MIDGKLIRHKYIRFRKNLTRFRKRVYFQASSAMKANWLYAKTMWKKECYFGPFTGEFGHLLGHNLPFISHLYSKGVKVHFCGMEIHRPFFVDDKGREIVASYVSIRDFFNQSLPNCNTAIGPQDIEAITRKFIETAKSSGLPYWDNSQFEYYFNFFRWWTLRKGYLKTFNLSRVYKTRAENSIVIFPRRLNPAADQKKQLENNGEVWNYYDVAKMASEYFDKVYVIGHPSFSDVSFDSFDNVEVRITNDNSQILELCCNSRLIVSQHSGSVYLGEYTNTPVLIIYKGGRVIGDIEITKQFKAGLGRRHEFSYAFGYNELEKFFNAMSDEKVRN
ncbi:MAG: hypothetical protein JNK79_15805 [Chitinophagaceae bacterium]|nr:hypothetical protein [Chitinophagaceae bacterium]